MKIFYLAAAMITMIFSGLFIYNNYLSAYDRPSLFERNVYCPSRFNDFGPDPFVPGTNIYTKISASLGGKHVYLGGSGQTYTIWQKEFWQSNPPPVDLSFCEEQYAKMLKHQRDARLCSNINKPFLIGWDEQRVAQAFGEPDKKETVGEIEKWTYHPWEHDRTKALVINMKDKKLQNMVE